ncbi:MAG TPA: hypothetical protein VF486_06330 [Actinomycetes bacterium]
MLALLVVPLLVLAGCAQDNRSGVTPVDKAEAARAYAQCIRDNGVPDFPDPDANGELRGPAHEKQNDPKFQAAQEKCRNLAPGGEHQKSDPATVEQMRKFSQCMRDNGLPDFPDPDANGQLRGAGHEQQDTPTYRAAMEACRQKLPGGGNHQ